MTNISDFLIQNGVLKKYTGPCVDVVIPEGVTAVGGWAFSDCTGLVSVRVPENVTKIGTCAFRGCGELKSVTILGEPEISEEAFPESGVSIVAEQLRMGAYPVPAYKRAAARGFALRYSSGETLPEDYRADCLKYIRGQRKKLYPIALSDPALLHVMLAEKIVSKEDLPDLIDQAAAVGNAEITAMLLAYQEQQLKPGEREKLEEKKRQREMDFMLTGTLTVAEAKKVWRYEKDGEGNLTILGYKGKETEVEVPIAIGEDKVTAIGDYAFSPNSPRLTEDQREQRRQICSIRLPEDLIAIGTGVFEECEGLTSVNIPEGMTEIGECAFSGCTGLTSIHIPENVTEISHSAFEGCKGLTGMTIPAGVTVIGKSAFRGCTGLTGVTIPDGLTEIGACAFQGCTGLTSVSIPASVTKIGGSAFSGCTGLTSVRIPASVTKIGAAAFGGCTGLTRLEISPENRTFRVESGVVLSKDGKTVFFVLGSLTSVTIPKGVRRIGESAFSGCTNLTGVNIPAGVTKIGKSAFRGCTGLTGVTIPDGLTEIGACAFQGCTGLTSVSIPTSVTKIGGSAFEWCTSLTNVTIPDSVTEIGSGTFWGCTGLTSVTIPMNVTEISKSAFHDCKALTIHAPAGSYAQQYAEANGYPFVAC